MVKKIKFGKIYDIDTSTHACPVYTYTPQG